MLADLQTEVEKYFNIKKFVEKYFKKYIKKIQNIKFKKYKIYNKYFKYNKICFKKMSKTKTQTIPTRRCSVFDYFPINY